MIYIWGGGGVLGVFRPTRDVFHSYSDVDVTIAGEGLQVLT